MNKSNAVIKNARKDGCGFELDDGWYSAFNALSPQPNAGDTVTFDYKEKTVGGRTYKNIVEKTFSLNGSGGGGAVAPVRGVKDTGYSSGPRNTGFPIPTDHGNRAINRQSAIAQANVAMANTHTEAALSKMKPEDYTEKLIEFARSIEAYTTGDLDSEIVKALLDDANGGK